MFEIDQLVGEPVVHFVCNDSLILETAVKGTKPSDIILYFILESGLLAWSAKLTYQLGLFFKEIQLF